MEAGAPNFELPPQPPLPEQDEQGQEQAVEAPPARQEQVGKQAPRQPALPAIPDDIPAADQPVVVLPASDTAKAVPSGPHAAAASDTDRIENVWVNKVKDTAARNREDPYKQSSEMSKIKADYNLKRFNKQIKTDDPFDATQGRPELGRKGEAAA